MVLLTKLQTRFETFLTYIPTPKIDLQSREKRNKLSDVLPLVGGKVDGAVGRITNRITNVLRDK